MRTVRFFASVDLPVLSEQVSDLLNEFDWSQLPEYSFFYYRGVPRRSMAITFSDLGYASIRDYSEYHHKSFSTTIMQALVLLEIYGNPNR